MITSFLLCRHCQTLHALAPEGAMDCEFGLDVETFRARHAPHGVQQVDRVPSDVLFDRPTWDPMATRWFHVSAGEELLLVRSWRPTVDEPRRYEIELAGRAPIADASIDVDEALLRRALDRHFYPHALRPAVLDLFVGTVRELVDQLDPDEVDTAFDDTELPNTGIGAFPSELCEALMARCARVFDGWELERVRAFVADHRLEDGALAVRVRRDPLNRAA